MSYDVWDGNAYKAEISKPRLIHILSSDLQKSKSLKFDAYVNFFLKIMEIASYYILSCSFSGFWYRHQ